MDSSSKLKPQGTYGSTSPSVKAEKNKDEAEIQKLPFFLITLIVFFLNCASRVNTLSVYQYVYQQFARQLFGNDSLKTIRDPCPNASVKNSTLEHMVSEIHSQISSLFFHIDIFCYGIGIVSNTILGAYSNVLNRKVLLFIPVFGHFLRYLEMVIVVYWTLDVHWLYVGAIIEGLCGNSCGIYLGVFIYTSDVTPRNHKRILGMAIVETSKGLVTAALNVAAGHLIEHIGFLSLAIIAASFVFGSLVIIVFIPNRQPRFPQESTSSKWSPSHAMKSLSLPFQNVSGRPLVRKMVILGATAFFVIIVSMMGVSKIRILFLTNLPFCWSSHGIGYFLFGREIGNNIFTMVVVATLYKYLPGLKLAILGLTPYICGVLVYALAMTNIQLYFVLVLAIGQSLPVVMLRGELSRLLNSKQQGPLFAIMAVLESLSVAGGSMSLYIYHATVSVYPRPVYLVSTTTLSLGIVLLVWYQVLWNRRMRILSSCQTSNSCEDVDPPDKEDSSSETDPLLNKDN